MPYKDHEKYLEYQRQYHHDRYFADLDASRTDARSKYHKYKDLDALSIKHKERMENDPAYGDRTRQRKNEYNKRNLVNQKRRARLASAPVIETVERLIVAERDSWICQLCDKPIDPTATRVMDSGKLNPGYLHVDHKISLSNGGEHSYANCQASHAFCNWSKNNSD